jgi:hypothetical protein
MKQSIVALEKILAIINTYAYPTILVKEVDKMNDVWHKHRNFLYKSNELSVPNLLLSSETILKKSIIKIALYHK